MTLTLRITSYRGAPPAGNPSVTFDERGGTIGRSQDNDWVLPDPDRFISSRHAAVAWRDGRYYITDVSLNGVLVNGHKLGQGNSTVLNDGDVLGFGEYDVRVGIAARAARTLAPPEDEAPAFLPEGALGIGPVIPEPAPPALEPPRPEDLLGMGGGEPFTVPLSGVPGEPPSEPGPPMRDDLARIHEPFAPPRPGPAIPENWWEEEGRPGPAESAGPTPAAEPLPPLDELFGRAPAPPAEPSRSTPAAPEPPPGPFEATEHLAPFEATERLTPVARPRPPAAARPAPPPPEVPTPPPPPQGMSAEALLRGAGLDASAVAGLPEAQVLELAGELLRFMVSGLRELLVARASIKQEARLEMTTLRPTENNPLKFTVTTDDALRHLLRREPARGFLGPVQAVEEVMQDLKAHQLATLAGLEATLKGMFQRFDPARLEREFTDRSLLDSLVPGHRKGRCWDVFSAEFRRIAQEAEEDVQALFGREFARAYEEQVRRLRAAREGAGGPGHPQLGGSPL